MSYSVAPTVRIEVKMTASSAHGAHQGHDNRLASSLFAIADSLPQVPVRVE
jgi:hypothetical protein